MKISAGSTLLFIGDSITDCGRDPTGNPTPWDLGAGLGRGYVDLVAAHLGVTCPEKNIRIVNRGVSGNTVRDLARRWREDVLDLKPDWLSVMIGINDVWRQFDQPLVSESHVPPREFEKTLFQLTKNAALKGLILITPYLIEPNRSDPMRRRMDEYGTIVRRVAGRQKGVLVDAQAGFDAVLGHTHPMTLAWDRIHPSTTGHLVIAREFLRSIGAPQ